jgi:hypothetical protein
MKAGQTQPQLAVDHLKANHLRTKEELAEAAYLKERAHFRIAADKFLPPRW